VFVDDGKVKKRGGILEARPPFGKKGEKMAFLFPARDRGEKTGDRGGERKYRYLFNLLPPKMTEGREGMGLSGASAETERGKGGRDLRPI